MKTKLILAFICLTTFFLNCSKDAKIIPSNVSNSGSRIKTTRTHPGVLSNQADLDRAKAKVAAGSQPWKGSWDKLIANGHSSSSYTARPTATIYRGDIGYGQNYSIMYNDFHAAYQNALRYKIGGTAANGDKARDILNSWATTLTLLSGNADRFLAAGIYGYEYAAALELMRGYSGLNLTACQNMLKNIFYPMNHDFLVNHNGACITNYWANWDLCNMCSILAIGIVCDDQAKFDEAINYFKSGAGNGSYGKFAPFAYSDGLAQCQESGRDQGHTMLDISLIGTFCEMALKQGQNLYGYNPWSNVWPRVQGMCEYVAKYNLGDSVPFTTYNWGSGTTCAANSQTVISSASRGGVRPCWELIYNNFVNRRGQTLPYVTQFTMNNRPEGGGGDYGTDSGGYDQLGFFTLTNLEK